MAGSIDLQFPLVECGTLDRKDDWIIVDSDSNEDQNGSRDRIQDAVRKDQVLP